MSISHDGRATCNGCDATIPSTAPAFDRWERIEMRDGPEAHLCEQCRYRRDRGWLAEDYVLECARCKRNTVSNPEVTLWRTIPSMTGEPSRTVCFDCFDPIADSRFL